MFTYIKSLFLVFKSAFRHWTESNSFVYAAALAFFTVFSIAPIIILAVSIVGVFYGEQAAQGKIHEQLEGTMGTKVAEFVQEAVVASQLTESGILPTLLGFAAIMIGATTVFAQMQKSLNDIWDVTARPSKSSIFNFFKNRLLSLTLVLSIGFILLVSLVLSVALRAVINYAEEWVPVHETLLVGVELALSFAMITLLFAAIFKILPDVKLDWKDVFTGAAVTAILFITGRSLIAIYLANTATSSTYGAAASLVLLLLWVNYSSLILLFGAAFTRAQLEAAGKSIIPRNTAIKVKRTLVGDV